MPPKKKKKDKVSTRTPRVAKEGYKWTQDSRKEVIDKTHPMWQDDDASSAKSREVK